MPSIVASVLFKGRETKVGYCKQIQVSQVASRKVGSLLGLLDKANIEGELVRKGKPGQNIENL